MYTISPGLHRGLAETPVALMGPNFIELLEPDVNVGLQLREALVDVFPESHAIKLIQNGFVKSLADPVGLRVSLPRPSGYFSYAKAYTGGYHGKTYKTAVLGGF